MNEMAKRTWQKTETGLFSPPGSGFDQQAGTEYTGASQTFWSSFTRRQERLNLEAQTSPAVKPLNILLPTDFGASSQLAVNCALSMAAHQDARITLLHAIHLNLFQFGPVNVGDLKTVLCREALACAEHFLIEAHDLGATAFCMLEDGAPATAIINAARRREPDLIIMANPDPRRGFWGRWFGRGTVAKVVRNVPCPVLVVPAA